MGKRKLEKYWLKVLLMTWDRYNRREYRERRKYILKTRTNGYIYSFRLLNIALTDLIYEIYTTKYISTKSLRNIYYIYIPDLLLYIGHQIPYPNNLSLVDWYSQLRISFSICTVPLETLHNLNVPTSTQNVCWIPCTIYLLQTHHHLPLTF